MKHPLTFWLGQQGQDILTALGESIAARLTTLFSSVPKHADLPGFQKNAFYPDGSPVLPKEDLCYPFFAAWYLGTPIPGVFLDLEPLYRQTAAKAAISWIASLNYGLPKDYRNVDGVPLDIEYAGQRIRFLIPDIGVTGPDDAQEIVLPVADHWSNDGEWSGCAVPTYVEQHARLLLWCWGKILPCAPVRVRIVRVIGNLPSDVTVRTIYADPRKESSLGERVCRAIIKARKEARDPLTSLIRREDMDWKASRDIDNANAYTTDNPRLYSLIQEYMQARSQRKALEASDASMKSEMDAVAISLASHLSADAGTGIASAAGCDYTVRCTPSRTYPPTITASLLNQFAPEFAASVQHTETRMVNIDVL